jgi:3-oxoacyl-[acyl-carrier-protein] synthase-3
MITRYARITGWGKYIPEKVLTNDDLARMVDTSDEWITSRTGIKERHIRSEGETTSSMAVAASLPALAQASITPAELDLIIVANNSPDYLLPGVANLVQANLGAQCGAFTLVNGCSGWVYALVTASQFIQSGVYDNILVIGAEVISYAIDWQDRSTCVLFGDAAAAVVLQPSEEPAGVLTFELGSDGSGVESLYVPAGGTVRPIADQAVEIARDRAAYIKMDGRAVFKFATRVLASSLKQVIFQAGLTPDDIDLFIPHQANARIIELAAKLLRQPLDKFYVNIHKYGNTSAASIPLALVEAFEDGRVKPGDKIAVAAFGAGLSWAAAVVQIGVGELSPAHRLFSIGRARFLAKRAQHRLVDVAQALILPLYTFVRVRRGSEESR